LVLDIALTYCNALNFAGNERERIWIERQHHERYDPLSDHILEDDQMFVRVVSYLVLVANTYRLNLIACTYTSHRVRLSAIRECFTSKKVNAKVRMQIESVNL
jgi:hypothetical protein